MSLRDWMNNHPAFTRSLALAAVVAIGVVIWMEMRSFSPDKPGVYYTIDDGASYFSDAPDRVTPFERRGKQAVRAHVFRINDGEPFVGYLERQTPQAGAMIIKMKNRKPGDPTPTPAEIGMVMAGREFKKPGEAAWVPLSKGALVQKITAIAGPDGTQAIEVE